jgi:outer membrane lipoprotein SlyB
MKIQLIAASALATLALAGCATSPGYGGGGGYSNNNGYGNNGGNYNTNRCADCGIVTRINTVASGRAAPSATGAVLGGIVGAVAGHDLGGIRENTYVRVVNGRVVLR